MLLLQLEVPVPAIDLVAARAREAGARVVLNFAPFRSDALSLVRHATHLVVNESECALIVEALGIEGGDPIAQAAALAEKSETIVIVTLGREGAVAVGRGVSDKVAALQVTAIDTVGAGDTFCGYLAAGLSEGLSLDRVLCACDSRWQPCLHESWCPALDPATWGGGVGAYRKSAGGRRRFCLAATLTGAG